ncbi:MAG: hypothetical protein KME17_27775 [Cyanosarcina radialis HA8281-LM2]|nr:hypothetical protein [Cyanosarcina radialis HA8281-LM2]
MTDAALNTDSGSYFSSLTLLFVVGFIAAVTIGSIAWYNSKRPEGWEDKERPSIVPEIEKEETPGLGTPES